MTVVVDWCSHAAAKHAVLRWHYSRSMPLGRCVHVGVWEDERFAGALVFGYGGSSNLATSFGVTRQECVELCRIALRDHEVPVTQVVAEALRMLRSQSPGLRVVASYADQGRGHYGRIYQAGNWIYLGEVAAERRLQLPGGRVAHRRAYAGVQFGGTQVRTPVPPGAKWVPGSRKFRYAYPLDRKMRRDLLRRAEPYPSSL